MKTLLDYLRPEGKFSQKNTDKLCLDAKNYAIEFFELSKDEGRALYRFAALTLNYLDKECNDEDINFMSFFKLLNCAKEDGTFKTEEETPFDILIGDAEEHGHEGIIILANYWYDIYNKMPDNAHELYYYGFARACEEYEIEWDEDILEKLKAFYEEAKEPEAKQEYEYLGHINNFLNAFDDYTKNRTKANYDEAYEALEKLLELVGMDMQIYLFFKRVLDVTRVHGPVFSMIESRYNLKI